MTPNEKPLVAVASPLTAETPLPAAVVFPHTPIPTLLSPKTPVPPPPVDLPTRPVPLSLSPWKQVAGPSTPGLQRSRVVFVPLFVCPMTSACPSAAPPAGASTSPASSAPPIAQRRAPSRSFIVPPRIVRPSGRWFRPPERASARCDSSPARPDRPQVLGRRRQTIQP